MSRSILASALLLMLLLIPSVYAFLSPPNGIQVKYSRTISRSTKPQPLYSTSEWQGKSSSPISLSVNQPNATPATANNALSNRRGSQLKTLLRVAVPSLVIGTIACLTFPSVSMTIASLIHDAGAFSVLSQDSSQFVQNFLNVAGLLFSILVGQTCTSVFFFHVLRIHINFFSSSFPLSQTTFFIRNRKVSFMPYLKR